MDRLLQESLGGDLVNTSDADWEKDELTRKKVKKGLKRKLVSGAISQEQSTRLWEPGRFPKAPEGRCCRELPQPVIAPSPTER